ncbi:MAG: hypothetical protein ABIJ52_14620 [Pseudomonadota bacterium]
MTEVCIHIPVENIAGMIINMDKQELETLCLLLSNQGQELRKRMDEMALGKVRMLSREEVFDV